MSPLCSKSEGFRHRNLEGYIPRVSSQPQEGAFDFRSSGQMRLKVARGVNFCVEL